MIDAMVVRGFAARTQECYVEAIARMARHYRREPGTTQSDEVEAYLLHLVKDAQALLQQHEPGRQRSPLPV